MKAVTKASRLACCSGMCIYERPDEDCPAEDRHGDGAAAMLDALASPTPEMIEAGRIAAAEVWRLSRSVLPDGSDIVRAVWAAMMAEARK